MAGIYSFGNRSVVSLLALCLSAQLFGCERGHAATDSRSLGSILQSLESSLNSLAATVQRQHSSYCNGTLTPPSSSSLQCVALSCTTVLANSVCTNNSDYGNLVGMGCPNCTGRQLDLNSSSIQLFTNVSAAKVNSLETSSAVKWTESIDEEFQGQSAANPELRFQHLTLEAGALTRSFPGYLQNSSVCGRDSRSYPRYATALAGYKDVVIAMDNSGTANRQAVIESVIAVLDTLTGFDRFAVVIFDQTARPLETEDLQIGTPANIDIAKLLLRGLSARGTRPPYSLGLPKSLDLLNLAGGGSVQRFARRVVIFFSQQSQSGNGQDLVQSVEFRLQPGDIILTYSIGSEPDGPLSGLANTLGGFHTTVPRAILLPAVSALYTRYLLITSANSWTQPTWSNPIFDAVSKNQSVTVSRPVFRSGYDESLYSLIGVVSFDVAVQPLLDSMQDVPKSSRLDELRSTVAARRQCNNSKLADICRTANAIPVQWYPNILSAIRVTSRASSNCSVSDLPAPLCFPSASYTSCSRRSRPSSVPCCTIADSNCTTTSSDSSGISTAAIISICVWTVILCAYPLCALVGKIKGRLDDCSCSCPRCCRRNSRPARRSTARVATSPRIRHVETEIETPVDPLATGNDQELTEAAPPSYNVALATTSPTHSSGTSSPAATGDARQPPNSVMLTISIGSDNELPPPSYDELAQSAF